MDSNGDVKVSGSEHATGAKVKFDAMDSNRDASVTAVEMDAYKQARMSKGEKSGATMSSAEKIATIDTDKDGQLSVAEHAAGAKAMFTKMDGDADGFLTADEIQRGHDEMMKKPD